MSSLRNAFRRRAYKERSQPHSRRKFGLLEKHKDYVKRAQAFHKKEQTLQKLKEKAAFRNPDEFYFRMIRAKNVDGVHKLKSKRNKYNTEDLMFMTTQDRGYISQKLQSEKKKLEKLTAVPHSLDGQPSNRKVYFAEDREKDKEIRSHLKKKGKMPTSDEVFDDDIRREEAKETQSRLKKKGKMPLREICMLLPDRKGCSTCHIEL